MARALPVLLPTYPDAGGSRLLAYADVETAGGCSARRVRIVPGRVPDLGGALRRRGRRVGSSSPSLLLRPREGARSSLRAAAVSGALSPTSLELGSRLMH